MIKGALIDFGGTIDSDGIHWFNMFREAYSRAYANPATCPDYKQPVASIFDENRAVSPAISDESLREAYIYAERTLGRTPMITPDLGFHRTLMIKLSLQTEFLRSKGILIPDTAQRDIVDYCYSKVESHISSVSGPVLETLSQKMPVVLVTNFYGNMHSVLDEFRLSHIFRDVIESSVVGVRKPDVEIFRLGVEALGLEPSQTVMIGDSGEKDIVPAQSIGCHTIWLRGETWSNTDCTPERTISSLSELMPVECCQA